jgi:hypothetical protein
MPKIIETAVTASKPKCTSCGRGFTADGKCHYCTPETAVAPKTPKAKSKKTEKRTGMPGNAPLDPILGINHPDYVAPEMIEYNLQHGISEEQTREAVKREQQTVKTIDIGWDRPLTSQEAFSRHAISDRIGLERRAALVEGRDPHEITEENVDQIHAARTAGETVKKVKREDGTIEKVVKVLKPVENSYGVDLSRTESGKVVFFGHPVTSVFRWMGSQGWTHDEAMTALKNLGLTEDDVSESTARIQMNAGRKGGDCGGRGPIPEISEEQGNSLRKAAGLLVEEEKKPEEVKKPKPKKKAEAK